MNRINNVKYNSAIITCVEKSFGTWTHSGISPISLKRYSLKIQLDILVNLTCTTNTNILFSFEDITLEFLSR